MEPKTSCPFTQARKVLSLARHSAVCTHNGSAANMDMLYLVSSRGSGEYISGWQRIKIKDHHNLIILYRACVSLIAD